MMILGVIVSALFVWAPNTTILFIARAIEGIALGGFIGTVTAFLIDYSLPDQAPRVTMMASITTMLGFGLGPGFTGVLAEYVPWNVLQLPYLLHGTLTIIALLAVLTVRETTLYSGRITWRILIGVPAEVRWPFYSFIAPSCFLLFALNGTIIALIPGYVETVLYSKNFAISGFIIFFLLGVGGVAQLLVQRRSLVPVTQVGLVLTVIGAWIMLEAGRSTMNKVISIYSCILCSKSPVHTQITFWFSYFYHLLLLGKQASKKPLMLLISSRQ
jgi:MFS family permease